MEYIETVPISYFIDELMLLDGIEQAMAEDYARRAIIDFATKTQVLTRETEIELTPCADEYLLDIPQCERVVKLISVCGYRVVSQPPCSYGQVPSCGDRRVWFVPPDSIKLSPTPKEIVDSPYNVCNSEGNVKVTAVTAPKRDCCEVDAVFYELYRDAIIDKALAQIYMVKSARWYDINLYKIHDMAYREAISRAKHNKVMSGHKGFIRMGTRSYNG